MQTARVLEGVLPTRDPREIYKDSIAAPERRTFYSKYPVGITWERIVDVMLRDLILSDKPDEEKIFALQETFLYSIDQDHDRTKQLTLECWLNHFKKKGSSLEQASKGLSESKFYDSRKIIHHQGKPYSLDFFSKLNLAQDMIQYAHQPGTSFNVLEVGGGYGQLARVLKELVPSMKYVCVDLPETLYFAYVFLKLNFPSKKIAWPSSAAEARKTLDEGDFDFCLVPCFFAEALAGTRFTFSAAVNKSSFGEMTKKASAFYIDLIQNQLKVDTIFFQNRFMNSVDPYIQPYRLNENQWYNNVGPQWDVVTWELEPEFTRFAYNEILHQREVYLIAKKAKGPHQAEPVDDILNAVWYKNFTIMPFGRHCKLLADDFSKGGTLERLVNSVRLKPTEKNLDALVKYIYLLEGKFPFEERFFYAAMYREITGRKHMLASWNPLRRYRIGTSLLRYTGVIFFINTRIGGTLVTALRGAKVKSRWTYTFVTKLFFNEQPEQSVKDAQ